MDPLTSTTFIFVLHILTLNIFAGSSDAPVVRREVILRGGAEPYRSVNYFVNKQVTRSICLFMFCWTHYANCKSTADCCECKCRNGSTFFSDPLGCREGEDVRMMTRDLGAECSFVTHKFEFHYVPLFQNQSKFVNIQMDLPGETFDFHSSQTYCLVGSAYELDYHGHKVLITRNHCNSLFRMYSKGGKKHLQYHSSNASTWYLFTGKLISLNIDCHSRQQNRSFSSCFVFQVEGNYRESVHHETPSPPSEQKDIVCPTWQPHTPSTSTHMATANQSHSTTVAITRMPANPSSLGSSGVQTTLMLTTTGTMTSAPATSPESLPTSSLPNTTSLLILGLRNYPRSRPGSTPGTRLSQILHDYDDAGATIGILTGLGTGLAVIMTGLIVWMFVKKRKELLKSSQSSNVLTATSNNPDSTSYEGSCHYNVPSIQLRSLIVSDCSSSSTSTSYIDTSGKGRWNLRYPELEFTERHSGGREDSSLFLHQTDVRSGSMSNRPLPEKPLESGNPYYSPVAARAFDDGKKCEINDIYSLYSTIDDLDEF